MKKKFVSVVLAVAMFGFSAAAFADAADNGSSITITVENVQSYDPAQTSTGTAPATPIAPASPVDSAAPVAPAAPAEVPSQTIAGRPLNPAPMKAGEVETEQSLLVTAEWLKANAKNVIIVDARPESLYSGGHIPGAVNASWTYFAKMNVPAGHMRYRTVLSPASLSKRIGALGIDGKKTVVAYCDAGGWGQSGWTVWILRMAGIKNAKILDGGFTAWKEAGGAVSKTAQKNKPVAFNLKEFKPGYVVDTEWVNNNLGKPGLVLLDVRTDGEYNGKIRPFGEKRMGHLPGAVHIEMSNFVKDGQHFIEEADVEALVAAKGISKDSEIVVYDTAGVRAAFVTMVLRYAGYSKAMCYDEGFQAWAGQKDLPLD